MGENFYSNLDLRYAELAYNKKEILRANPGIIPFYIPALYPSVDGSTELNQTIRQNNRSLVNKQAPAISNVTLSNYININVPRELCGYINGQYTMNNIIIDSGNVNSTYIDTHTYDLNIRSGGAGDSSHSHSGTVTVGGGVNEKRDISINQGIGTVDMIAVDSIIPIDSTWLVMFLGGDINRPIIICRCYI